MGSPQGAGRWNAQGGSEDPKALDLVSGMTLVSSLHRPPGLSGSSISSAPGDEHNHHRHHSLGSISFPNSEPMGSGTGYTGSSPPSPSSPVPGRSAIGSAKPPGFYPSLPSPIGRSSIANNTLSSSPNLTLTPHSTFEGTQDSQFVGLRRQGSPFDPNASSPWADLGIARRELGDTDSFDRSDDPEDGLVGLGALRERAQSSPGPVSQRAYSSSPPVRIDVNTYQGDLSPLPTDSGIDRNRPFPPDPRRLRPSSYGAKTIGTRPPLSGQIGQAQFSNPVEGLSASLGNIHLSNSDAAFDYSALGSGSHVDARSEMAERLHGRSRSITLGYLSSEQNPYFAESRNSQGDQSHHQNMDYTHKFGSLPNLSNVQHLIRPQQVPSQQARHIRSNSYSGALHSLQEEPPVISHHEQHGVRSHQRFRSDGIDVSDNSFLHGGEAMYRIHSSSLPRSFSVGDHYSSHSTPGGILQRSVSITHPILPKPFEGQVPQRRNADFLQGASHQYAPVQPTYHYAHPSLQRRDEFIGLEAGSPLYAAPEDIRAIGLQSQQGRVAVAVPRRHRTDSDMPSDSFRSGGRYFPQSQDPRSFSQSGFDDDLTHPLVGEHIDDPGDDHLNSTSNRYVATDALALATAGVNLPTPGFVYTVKFKRTHRNFVLGPRVSRELKIGCYVKVEADRGEDLGILIGKIPAEKLSAAGGRSAFRAAGSPGSDLGAMNPPISDLKRIIRLATHDEVSLLAVKREEEEELLKVCRTKVRQRALPMHVVDAEYQFDRHKLTFFFEAEGRIDFRELVRDLFSMYKTRIWMQQLDKNGTGTSTNSLSMPSDPDDVDINQTPIMADNMDEPYGISSDQGAGHSQA